MMVRENPMTRSRESVGFSDKDLIVIEIFTMFIANLNGLVWIRCRRGRWRVNSKRVSKQIIQIDSL